MARGKKEDYEVEAVGFETIPITVRFEEDDIAKMQIEHTNKLLLADRLSTELKAHNDLAKGAIKNALEIALATRNKIASGSEMRNVETALIPNFEKGLMEYIDIENSNVVFDRKLTPAEKQLRENFLRIAKQG